MRLVLVTTDENLLKDFLRKEICKGNIEYAGWHEDTDAAIEEFDEDWETLNIADMNSKLSFGLYQCVADGEEC